MPVQCEVVVAEAVARVSVDVVEADLVQGADGPDDSGDGCGWR